MPIEIREVVIKATVTNDKSKGSGSASAGMSAQDKQDMISTCVEQVMQIINDKKDR